MSKSRTQKADEYEARYSDIPREYDDRIKYIISHSRFSPNTMDSIIEQKRNITSNLFYYEYKIVLFEDPEGAKRPRFRMINRKNFANLAMKASNFVHVYSPEAAEDHKFIHRMLGNELVQLNNFIQTPCQVCINVFFKTPSYFSNADKLLAEIGIHRHIQKPDWDNIGKKYTDMFNENLWLDDNLVWDGEVHKYYSILPRVEIYIRYLNCVTNFKQYDKIVSRRDYNSDYPIQYLDKEGNIK